MAKPGQMVVAQILDYPTYIEQPTGSHRDRSLAARDRKASLLKLPSMPTPFRQSWPKKVRDSIKKYGKTVPADAKNGRKDFRDTPLLTIDGADARDFDDAVYCEPAGKGWKLIVRDRRCRALCRQRIALSIKEAINRSTSVYFPDRVVPMLPEVLSNGLCSLNPKVDRLCMVCEMKVDANGKVSKATFSEGLMRSAARLTYSQVNDFLSGKSAGGSAESGERPGQKPAWVISGVR